MVVTGLDIGGAHLKVAQVTKEGICILARQEPCRLWEGLDRLDTALTAALGNLPPPTALAITMTGELVDLFPDRATGVLRLLDRIEGIGVADARIFAAPVAFLTLDQARARPLAVASMNWLASAALVAAAVPQGLFVDVGSTTTDLLVLRDGVPRTAGETDAERLETGELVYVGLTRTPLMALAERAPVAGAWRGVMAEYFATTADAWRVLGLLDEAADQHAAADKGPKTVAGSARRLARMVGSDLAEGNLDRWRQLARFFADRTVDRVAAGAAQLLSREALAPEAPVVATGVGSPVSRALAVRLGRPYVPASSLVEGRGVTSGEIDKAFPAVAVAALRARRTA